MSNVTNICVSLIVLGVPLGAIANEPAPAVVDAAPASAADPAPDAGQTAAAAQEAQPAAPAGQAIQEVLVTAQKRSENAQRVPIAISTISEKNLQAQHITSTEDLPALLPGLKVGNSAGSGLVYLRGTGQNSGAPGIVNPISTYLDGIYIGIARLGLFDLPAVSQIALLRGPQGSLFGRNASGGIIQVATKDPRSTPGGSAQLGYGNFGTVNGSFYATGALSETVAANISFKGRRQSEGAIQNVLHRKRPAERTQLFRPVENSLDAERGHHRDAERSLARVARHAGRGERSAAWLHHQRWHHDLSRRG